MARWFTTSTLINYYKNSIRRIPYNQEDSRNKLNKAKLRLEDKMNRACLTPVTGRNYSNKSMRSIMSIRVSMLLANRNQDKMKENTSTSQSKQLKIDCSLIEVFSLLISYPTYNKMPVNKQRKELKN